jgi:hypothetical protein
MTTDLRVVKDLFGEDVVVQTTRKGEVRTQRIPVQRTLEGGLEPAKTLRNEWSKSDDALFGKGPVTK